MNIFISWSGEKGQLVAVALKAFLQDVNQRILAWFSDTDISAGERWSLELALQLEETDFGIVCVTQESIQSPWILFEAGALSRSLKGGRVCPYLVDLNRRQLHGPLAQFQAKEATMEQTWQMLQAINLAMGNDALSEDRLRRYFDTFWPQLEAEIAKANSDLHPLPSELRQMLLNVLPRMIYDANDIRRQAEEAGISVWKINWNQAAINIWNDLLQVASVEQRTLQLVTVIHDEYIGNSELPLLLAKVTEWQASLV